MPSLTNRPVFSLIAAITKTSTPLVLALSAALVSGCAADGTTIEPDAEPDAEPELSGLAAECAADDEEDGITRPAGWTAESHCKHAAPDYARVFGDGTQVLALTVQMTADEYNAMNADLADLMQGGPGGFPPEWEEACEGLGPGAACSVTEGDGECFAEGDALVCFPEGGGGFPPGWVEACEGLSAGDACEAPEGAGSCIDDFGYTFCFPGGLIDDNTAECEGKSEGDACEIEGQGAGTCFADGFFDGALNCFVDGGFGDIPNPCQDKNAGEACSLSGLDGECVTNANNSVFISCSIRGFGDDNTAATPDAAAAPFWDRKPAYFRATVRVGDEEWTDVGIRYKGNNGLASSIGPKFPLRLEFDQHEDEIVEVKNQRFYGFKEFSLANNTTDPSFLNQHAAATTFAQFGVPAPRTTPTFITLDVEDADPVELGLYTLTEIPGNPLLDDVFGENDGNLYKPDGRGAHFVEFVEASFHKKNNKDAADFSDVSAFVSALNATDLDAEAWRTALEARFNMNGFIRFLAVNQTISNWDTYGGLAHNFYLYSEQDSGVVHFIPWDFDLALSMSGPSDLSLLSFNGDWPLIQAVAHDPVYYYAYHQALADAYVDLLRDDTLVDDIATWAEAIRPFAEEETSVNGFNDAIGEMNFHVSEQRQRSQAYLEARGVLPD